MRIPRRVLRDLQARPAARPSQQRPRAERQRSPAQGQSREQPDAVQRAAGQEEDRVRLQPFLAP